MTAKKEIEEKKEVITSEELVGLDSYIKVTEINAGLVASFRAEAENDVVTPRSEEQWAKDFKTQSGRKY